MRKNLRKRIMVGVAAAALMAPLALSGFAGASAATTQAAPTNQVAAQSGQQQGTTNGSGSTAGQQSQQTPAQKEAMQAKQKAFLKQLQKQMAAQQKKQQAKMLKTAQTLFVTQGKRVYTLKTDITKNKKGQEQVNPIPGIKQKYFSSLRRFGRLQRQKIQEVERIQLRAKRTRSKKARKSLLQRAQRLYLQYARVASLPTKAQQKAQAKAAAKKTKVAAKKAKRSRNNKKKNRRRISRKAKTRTKKNRRQNKQTAPKNDQPASRVLENGDVVLTSKFKRGSTQAAQKAGFAQKDFPQSQINAIFDPYDPNDSRAVIPSNYRIAGLSSPNQDQTYTVWFPGQHYTNNINDLNNLANAYYYNDNDQGWINFGSKWSH